MIILLNLLACGPGGPSHSAPDAHAPAEPAEAHAPAPVHTGEPSAPDEPEPPAEDHAPAEPVPADHSPEPEAPEHEAAEEPAVEEPLAAEEPGRALRVLLRPLLLALPVLLGVRFLGGGIRRRLPHLRSTLFLVELAVLSGVLLWVAARVLVLLESVSLNRPGMVILGLLAVAMLPVVLRLVGHLRGLWLITSSTLRVGDTIEAPGVHGTIDHIGLIQLTLKGADGEAVIIRYDALNTASIRIIARQDHAPIELWVEPPVDAEKLRRLALLSPYRRAGTPVTVAPAGDRVRVQMVLWSPEVEEQARALLLAR